MNNKHKIILILGMHRSGTSLIAQLISKWGAYMGKDLMPANKYNEDGYWEYNPLVNFHEKLLKITNNKWYAPSWEIDAKKLLNEFGDEARQLVRDMDEGGDIWCWKDPRMPLFLDFWKEILAGREIVYILSNRQPQNIAGSLFFRDNMPASIALALWEFTIWNIFRALSSQEYYKFIDYDKIINEPEILCKELFDYLNKVFQLPETHEIYEEMVQSVKKSLNHAKPGILFTLSSNQKMLLNIIEQEHIPVDFGKSENQIWFLKEMFSIYRKLIFNTQNLHFAQLFFKNKCNEYNENNSLIIKTTEHIQKLCFKFGISTEVNQLRFDPLNDYAHIRVHSIQLFNRGKLLETPLILKSNALSFENREYLFDTNDPQIFIYFPYDNFAEIDQVIIDLEYVYIGVKVMPLILNFKQQNIEQKEDKIAVLSELLQTSESQKELIKVDLARKNELAKEHEVQIVGLVEKIEGMNRQYEYLNKILGEIVEQLSISKHEAEELKNEMILKNDRVKMLEQQIGNINGMVSSLQNSNDENINQINELNMQLKLKYAELLMIKKSFSFRLSRMLLIPMLVFRPSRLIRLIRARIYILRNTQLIKQSGLFDEMFYIEQNQDVKTSGMSSTRHYLLFGGLEGRNPSEKFDSAFYLEQNPDMKALGINPLVHYLKFGMKEGRSPISRKNPQACELQQITAPSKSNFVKTGAKIIQRIKGYPDLQLLRNSEYFNAEYYLRINPDVKAAGIDPAEHYLYHGWKEGLNPSELFDTSFYLKKYRDVRQANINPLLHYIEYGQSENRICTVTSDNYPLWIKKYDILLPADIMKMQEALSLFKAKPLISVIMPVFNSNHEWLKEAIDSVINQIYPFWELCIADDCSTDSEIKDILEYYRKTDSRIKVTYRTTNGHISASSNSALELATGEFVALLDHDDILPIHALYWVANAINMNPDAKLIYSDEDKIDENGVRQNPYFKCDWNPELFYSQNMINHLGIYNTAIVRKIGGFRIGFEGSQDYDLALRFIEQIDSIEIFHIPKVLYHWRLHDDSTSRIENCKTYAYVSGEKALNEHFRRIKKEAFANVIRPGMYRLKYPLPTPEPHITFIIPTKDQVNLLRNCIKSVLKKTTYTSFDVIIIDNGSYEPESVRFLDEIKKDKRITCIRDNRPFNYSALNNIAVSAAKGEFVCLLNNDIEVINSDWLSEMVSVASQPGIGAVGAKLYFPDEHIQHAGVILGIGGVAGHAHKFFFSKSYGYFGRAVLMQEMSAVTGACMVVKRSVYLEAGGLDELNLPIAFNDVDFCLKLKKAGYRNIWTPCAELYHHESVSRGSENTEEKKTRFKKEGEYMKSKWGSIIETDPAYNPNLTLISENFELAWPPRNLSSYKINQSE